MNNSQSEIIYIYVALQNYVAISDSYFYVKWTDVVTNFCVVVFGGDVSNDFALDFTMVLI